MAGYSGTPLIKKLGIKKGCRIALVNAPKGFEKELGSLPLDVRTLSRPTRPLDFVLLFTNSAAALEREFSKLAEMLLSNGMLWVAWPKKASGVITDLSENNVRQIGLDAGLVDVKVQSTTFGQDSSLFIACRIANALETECLHRNAAESAGIIYTSLSQFRLFGNHGPVELPLIMYFCDLLRSK
jgi:hypothetical protein